MRGEKRAIEGGEGEDLLRKKKQRIPDAKSILMQASLVERFHHVLEPLIRKIVREELVHGLTNLGHIKHDGRLPAKQLQASDIRKLQLHFTTRLPETFFTRRNVKGKQGDDIQIMLVDANTGNIISSGPESFFQLEIVVLCGDFDDLPDADWSQEHFERHLVKEREGKGPLVVGQLKVALKNGVATIRDLNFSDNSRWTRSQKFRLGARVIAGQSKDMRVREAKSEAFSVKENRGESYEKHDRPDSNDKVWRLRGIAKNGPYHQALTKELIFTVEDFVRHLVMDPEKLRSIFGTNLSKWEKLVEHAKRCTPSKKIYAYYDGEAERTLIFNNIYEVRGLLVNGHYIPVESLPVHVKVDLNCMKRKAYGDRGKFKELDEDELSWFVHQGRCTEPNPATLEPCLPVVHHVGQLVEEFSNPTMPMEHTEVIFVPMPQQICDVPPQQAVLDTPPGKSSVTTSSGHLTAATPPSDRPGFVDSVSCSSYPGEIQVGISESGEYLLPDVFGDDEILGMLNGDLLDNLCFPNNTLQDANAGFGFWLPFNQRSQKAITGWLKLRIALRSAISIGKFATRNRVRLMEQGWRSTSFGNWEVYAA